MKQKKNWKKLKTKKLKILVLKVEKEVIHVDFSGDCSIENVSSKIETSQPRFTFWIYNHTFEEKDLQTVYFIYSCPTSSKVKDRTVFSSGKNPLLSYVSGLGLKIEQNLECSEVSDLTSTFLHEYLHPQIIKEEVYKKPTRPGRPVTKK